MAVQVVELSSDSEDEDTKKEYISKDSSDLAHSEVDNHDQYVRVGRSSELLDTASKVPTPKTRSTLSVDEVRRLVKGGELTKVTVPDLQSYARVEGLIIGGCKPVLIDRIKTHIEILEQGVDKYSSESFTVDCSGDICVGDVVRFKQRVYDNFNPFNKAPPDGMRIVAGRVVRESYGKITQQHTFTIEVLWSSGYRALAPMRQLQIKGRNLYKFTVSRQIWEDEKMRLTILDEKHERGAIAKLFRRLKRPLTGAARGSLHAAVGTKRKRKHSEICSGSKPVSLISRGSTVGSKRRKKIPTVVQNRPCRGARPKQRRLIIQQPRGKGLMQKQAQKPLFKFQSKQLSETGGTKKTKRSRADRRRVQKRRRRERLQAERLRAGIEIQVKR